MFGKRAAAGVTSFTATITVSYLTLFTHHSGLGRLVFVTKLTINNSIRFCVITTDNIFQEAVTREPVDSSAIERKEFFARRTL